MRDKLIESLNCGLPHLDWKAGARHYLSAATSNGHGPYSMSKPFAALGPDPWGADHETFYWLLQNFLDMLKVARLPGGSRVLDCACGTGWFADWLARLGYKAMGVDISPEMIAAAATRATEATYAVCDLEQAIPPGGPFDAAFLESCLHHFLDPVAALENVAASLSPLGLIVCSEHEQRMLPEHEAEMREYGTLERPLTRAQLESALDLAGLPCREFCCPINGWFSPRGPQDLTEVVRRDEPLMNRFIAAKTPEAIQRVLPWWVPA